MKFKIIESLKQTALRYKTAKEFARSNLHNVWVHSTDAKRFDKFNTSEIWFETDSMPGYGDRDVVIYYKINKPFVTSQDEYIHQDYKVSAAQAKKNKELYEFWGGEVNPESFNKMRTLGYDTLIDDEGYAALHPNKVTILSHRTNVPNAENQEKLLIKFWKKIHDENQRKRHKGWTGKHLENHK